MRAPIHDLHASNLVTYAALAAALGAAIAAVNGHPALAGAALGAAVIGDTFDGRFARLFSRTERQARVGRDLDSLVDAIAFGLVPVIVLAASSKGPADVAPSIWWLAGSAYALAAVGRLVFYNVEEDAARFVGLPAPAAALVCLTAMALPVPAWGAPFALVICGAAMVAPFSFQRPRRLGLAAFALWAIVLTAWFGL